MLQDTDTRRRLAVAIKELGRVHIPEPEEDQAKQLRRILSRRPPPKRRSFLQFLWAVMYGFLLYSVKTMRFMVDVILGLLTLVFLVIWGLKLPHPPKWDTWWVVERTHEIGEPVLAQIDAFLDWPEAVPYYPFMLVFLLSVGRVIVDSRLARILRQLRKLEPRSKREYTYASALSWRLEQDAQKHN